MEHLKYRPDIDGLRAIAVLSVVIFHYFPSLLPGGFVGVDIFFVISGYLITSIILKSASNKSFSYLDFYKRRVLRIFPALSIVLVSCLIVGWVYLFGMITNYLVSMFLAAHSLYQTLLFGVSLAILIQSHTLNLYYICGHWELKSNFI
ncbi:hypothetical protein CHC30_07305 [Salmonella enterica]|nr:hypothetical protein CHC30_07305 [Salmonella enterica]